MQVVISVSILLSHTATPWETIYIAMQIKLITFFAVFVTMVSVASAVPSPDPRNGSLDGSLWGASNSRNSWDKPNSYIYSSGSATRKCAEGDIECGKVLCRRRRSTWPFDCKFIFVCMAGIARWDAIGSECNFENGMSSRDCSKSGCKVIRKNRDKFQIHTHVFISSIPPSTFCMYN
ncbi:hypothetical protein J3R30DRAFT_305487 [Lentinula aciculospora]|uniref:Uncharacterized protein n=1 Tax=Lentinula aciculospora TaxID=153920 RepID=A0A9W9A7X3_9AGAR|nr:hypothetical protein J3R30DRAFT_305487 [Lentinula aciculospora]